MTLLEKYEMDIMLKKMVDNGEWCDFVCMVITPLPRNQQGTLDKEMRGW